MVTEQASSIELIVQNWLIKKGITDFEFQVSIGGGRYELGGAVVDCLSYERGLAWRLHGGYWHKGVEKEGTDLIQRELLVAQGWTVVDIWEDDLRDPARREYTLNTALQGEEVF